MNFTRTRQARACHLGRHLAKARVEAARYKDGNGKHRAEIARINAKMRSKA
jgi:hypothetical protein